MKIGLGIYDNFRKSFFVKYKNFGKRKNVLVNKIARNKIICYYYKSDKNFFSNY